MTQKAPLELVKLAAQAIYDKKGFNILVLDVKGLSSITDYLIIAEANVDRHVAAIGHHIVDVMKECGERPVYAEGLSEGCWAAIDYLDFIIHIFGPQLRDFYAIERIWPTAKIVELNLNEHASAS
jgi:ribosome-associated protein